mmetsp:Transcript_157365/g.504828  ORF Transcript_157365/g.504828 Transcript_157365/m.504828 type:complete len:485 (+) Transcript_157365:1287-2741(+)
MMSELLQSDGPLGTVFICKQTLCSAKRKLQTLQVLIGARTLRRELVVEELHEVFAFLVFMQLEAKEGSEADFIDLDAEMGCQSTHRGIVARKLDEAEVALLRSSLLHVAPDLVPQISRTFHPVRARNVTLSISEPAPLHLVADFPEHVDLPHKQRLASLVWQNRSLVRFIDGNQSINIFRPDKSFQRVLGRRKFPLTSGLVELVEKSYIGRVLRRPSKEFRPSLVLFDPLLVTGRDGPLVEQLVIALGGILHVDGHTHGLSQAVGEDSFGPEGEEDRGVGDEAEEEGPSALQRPLDVRCVHGKGSAVDLLDALEQTSVLADVALPQHRTGLLKLLTADRREVTLVLVPKVRALWPGEVARTGGLRWEARAVPMYDEHLPQGLLVLRRQRPRISDFHCPLDLHLAICTLLGPPSRTQAHRPSGAEDKTASGRHTRGLAAWRRRGAQMPWVRRSALVAAELHGRRSGRGSQAGWHESDCLIRLHSP